MVIEKSKNKKQKWRVDFLYKVNLPEKILPAVREKAPSNFRYRCVHIHNSDAIMSTGLHANEAFFSNIISS